MDLLKSYILIFFIYSFLGWVLETTLQSIVNKRFVDRGFLIGPICPIYGVAVILISVLLKRYENDVIATFFLSTILCGAVEYSTSYIMEKIFKARWWDYSDKKYNINGRICLEFLFCFGIGCTLAVFVFNPIIKELISFIPNTFKNLFIIVLLIVFVIDIFLSSKIVSNLKRVSTEIKDNTIEISDRVRKIISSESTFYKRLVNAFPDIKEKVDFKKWPKLSKAFQKKEK